MNFLQIQHLIWQNKINDKIKCNLIMNLLLNRTLFLLNLINMWLDEIELFKVELETY